MAVGIGLGGSGRDADHDPPRAKDLPGPGHGRVTHCVHDDINVADLLVDRRPGVVDDLAGAHAHGAGDPDLAGLDDQVRLAFEQVFMFYLPRICEHCLNPSCVASCPSGINAYLFAERYGQGIPLASASVTLSTILALGTSVLWLQVLGVG